MQVRILECFSLKKRKKKRFDIFFKWAHTCTKMCAAVVNSVPYVHDITVLPSSSGNPRGTHTSNFPNFEAFYFYVKMEIDNFHGTSWKRVCVLNRTFVCWVHVWYICIVACLLSCLHWWIRCCVVPHVSHFFVITMWDPTLQFIL